MQLAILAMLAMVSSSYPFFQWLTHASLILVRLQACNAYLSSHRWVTKSAQVSIFTPIDTPSNQHFQRSHITVRQDGDLYESSKPADAIPHDKAESKAESLAQVDNGGLVDNDGLTDLGIIAQRSQPRKRQGELYDTHREVIYVPDPHTGALHRYVMRTARRRAVQPAIFRGSMIIMLLDEIRRLGSLISRGVLQGSRQGTGDNGWGFRFETEVGRYVPIQVVKDYFLLVVGTSPYDLFDEFHTAFFDETNVPDADRVDTGVPAQESGVFLGLLTVYADQTVQQRLMATVNPADFAAPPPLPTQATFATWHDEL